MNTNNVLTIATRNETGTLVPTVAGMALRKNRNTGEVTGIEIPKKKAFREKLVTQKNPKTGQLWTANEANAYFDDARRETIRQLGLSLSTKFASGEMQGDAIALDPITGQMKSVRLVKPQQNERDRVAREKVGLAKAYNIPLEKLDKWLAQNQIKEEAAAQTNANATVEAETRPASEAAAPEHVTAQ